MNISQLEFEILLDTLKGSIKIADRANIFFYEVKLRTEILNNLLKKMGKECLEIKEEK